MGLLRRVNYFEGRLLSAADFQAEQEYHREKSRRHSRRLHGCGVVLRYVERPVESIPSCGTGGDADAMRYSRIEEDCELVLVPDDPPRRRDNAGLPLARYVRSGSGWKRDRAFMAGRAAR